MGVLSRFLGLEQRSSPPVPAIGSGDPFLMEYFGLSGRFGRAYATPDEAVASLAVAARCVSLIAEGLAALPLRVYRYTPDGGRELAETHSLDVLLNDVANPQASGFMVREQALADVLMHGNGYIRQEIDGRGRVAALYYLPRMWVGVERLPSGRLRYRISEPTRATYIATEDEVIHLRYRTRDGVMGVSPLTWAGSAVGLAVAQADLAQKQADRGFTPDMAFTTDNTFPNGDMGEAAFRRLKEQLQSKLGNTKGGALALLLDSGLKPQQLAPTGREAQFFETRQAGLADVARIYGVPLSVLGLNAAASYGSLNEESRALVQNCFRPWARRIESELMRTAMTAEGRRNFTLAHDFDALLTGDMLSRFQAYQVGIQSEILSPNEARLKEGMNKRPGGDKYINPNTASPTDRNGPADPSPPASQGSQASAQPAES